MKYATDFQKKMVKKLDLTTNEKGEITSPTYVEIVSKINEIIEVLSVTKPDNNDLR